ncbi:MAG TPA: hypothetical protein VF595_05090 [Tepidisphaeraceae bacterium]
MADERRHATLPEQRQQCPGKGLRVHPVLGLDAEALPGGDPTPLDAGIFGDQDDPLRSLQIC